MEVAVTWLFGLLGALLVALVVAPMIRTGWWVIRILDFPRMQIAATSLLAGAGLLAVALLTGWDAWRVGLLVVFGLVLLWELAQMTPYTRLWGQEARPAAPGAAGDITLLIVNLDYRNTEHEPMRAMVERINPELLLLVELDEPWEQALAPVRETYPHRLGVTKDQGLGLALWSRLPLRDGGVVRYLVLDWRPSLWTSFELPDGRPVEFIGVHPTPPGLERKLADDRHDSRIRDAELVKIAREVAEHPAPARIVAGDFNDVAWSHTTRLFKRLSGLCDPRIGRGVFNTYHARRPLLRYPLDQVFISEGFRVRELERVKAPGSDHFAVKLRLQLDEREGADPEADAEDHAEAREMLGEGHADAREVG